MGPQDGPDEKLREVIFLNQRVGCVCPRNRTHVFPHHDFSQKRGMVRTCQINFVSSSFPKPR